MKKLILFSILVLITSTSTLAIDLAERRLGFVLPGIDGMNHSVNEWDDKALIVNFWATWCAPCLREIPLIYKVTGEPPGSITTRC